MKIKKLPITLFLILIITITIFYFTRVKNYSIEYVVNGFNVKETFDKESSTYGFIITEKDQQYDFLISTKHIRTKKLLNEIAIYEDEDTAERCIYPKSSKIEIYPLCKKDDKYMDLSLLESDLSSFYVRPEIETENGSYKNIKVNTTNGLKFLVWAHKGYYSITKEKLLDNSKKDLSPMFLSNESYYNKLSYQLNEYVLTPDYDQEYSFDKFYIFNFKKGSLTEWKLDREISYNSYYLGDMDGLIYMFDRKSETEYAINPKKKTIEIVSKDKVGKVYLQDWKEVSTTKLSNTEYLFDKKQNYTYSVEDDILTLKLSNSSEYITITTHKPDKIISQKDDKLYYLIEDRLYEYSLKYGEVLLLTYSEWAFNSLNSIYIY